MTSVDERCLSRIWNGGQGGQCKRRRVDGSEFCKQHSSHKGLSHGRIDDGQVLSELPKFRSHQQPPAARFSLDEERRRQICPIVSSLCISTYVAPANSPEVAVGILRRYGFVVVPQALGLEERAEVIKICQRVETEMRSIDTCSFGNRGHGRYSLGMADESGHMLHHQCFTKCLVDCTSVLDILGMFFGEDGYVCAGGGGDFVISGVEPYQRLHSDIPHAPCEMQQEGSLPPLVVANFCLEDLTYENGATRVIAGSQHWYTKRPPSVQDEPIQWLHSKVFPVAAGSVIIRDARAWHGGTPNLSEKTRFLPSAEFHSVQYRSWLQEQPIRKQHRFGMKCLPRKIFDQLSSRARTLCTHLVGDTATEIKAGVSRKFVIPSRGSDGSGGIGILCLS